VAVHISDTQTKPTKAILAQITLHVSTSKQSRACNAAASPILVVKFHAHCDIVQKQKRFPHLEQEQSILQVLLKQMHFAHLEEE
jgi:hypothetical protein